MVDRNRKTELSIRVGINVKRCREEKSWKQLDLAIELAKDTSYVSKIENGWANLTLDYIEMLSKALSVDPSELFKIPINEKAG